MDTLQINPPTCKGHRYVLVLINDFNCFSFTYATSEKGQEEEHIKSYLVEIKNKLDVIPSFLHADQEGEFSSQSFLNYLNSPAISLERGPPESPQNNGVSERFNQKLLSKIRCFLGKSNLPGAYWNEAVSHFSF
ncbi:hypothetical protein O181_111446 [Austropuccinia psidii MF-1]|uniref:Integrase catalytic domain-containing protein n=1 Tax=Austropuccinia psidii MF-1 TaxID=1389203 RepID=A0A9Q3PSN8_9BASI|nr:hypothetical protein [Austropuccinia psidii MF-1]